MQLILPEVMTRLETELDQCLVLLVENLSGDLDYISDMLQEKDVDDHKKLSYYLSNLTKEVATDILDVSPFYKQMLQTISDHGEQAIIFSYKNVHKNFKDAVSLYYRVDDEEDGLDDAPYIDVVMITMPSQEEEWIKAASDIVENAKARLEDLSINTLTQISEDSYAAEYIEDECTILLYPLSIYFLMHSKLRFFKAFTQAYDPDVLPFLQSSLEINENDSLFTKFYIKVLSNTLAHEMTHLIQDCEITKAMYAKIEKRKYKNWTSNPSVALDHCALFKLTLLYFCGPESSPIYIRPEFFNQIKEIILENSKYEFYVYNDQMESHFIEPEQAEDDEEEVIPYDTHDDFFNYAYTWEDKLRRRMIASITPETVVFTPASQVTKTKNLVKTIREQTKKLRKNNAVLNADWQTNLSLYKTQGFEGFPILAFEGEPNLLKIESTLRPFERLLQIFMQSDYQDASVISTKPGEAGLYMFLNGDEVEFLYVDKFGSASEVSLSEAWWLLSL